MSSTIKAHPGGLAGERVNDGGVGVIREKVYTPTNESVLQAINAVLGGNYSKVENIPNDDIRRAYYLLRIEALLYDMGNRPKYKPENEKAE